MAAAEFKIQRGTTTIPSGTSVTLTAGVDYTAPASAASAFIRLCSTRMTGMGNTSGGTQPTDDTSCWIDNPSNILTSVNITRVGSANDCRVTWELVEYIGAGGGANEMIVRAVGTGTTTGTAFTGTTVTTISDNSDVVVFITGQRGSDVSTADWLGALFTASLVANASDWDPTFTRGGTAGGDSGGASYAVVEFTGSNWSVHRKSWTATVTTWAAGNSNSGTEAIGTTLSDITKSFVHVQYSTSNDATGLDDGGDSVTIDSTTNFRVYNRATAGTRTKVAWVVSNSQASDGMVVQHFVYADDTTSATEERVWTQVVNTVRALDESSVLGSVSMDGGGTAWPRGCIDLRLTTTSQLTLSESDAGQERRFCIEVIQWPQAAAAGPVFPVASANGINSLIFGGQVVR